MTNNASFKVIRSDVKIDDISGYDYKFIFKGDRPEGKAQVLFNSVEFYDSFPQTSQRFRELGLRADQTVAHLNKFYPNGEGIPDDSSLMRQGIGTAALELIVADAKERGAKIMHVFSTARPGMVAFMERNGIKTYYPEPREDGTLPKYRLACKLL